MSVMQPIGDPGERTVWEGRRLSVAGQITGGRLPAPRYRATTEHLYWTTGRLARKTESAPIWAVREATVEQNLKQRARRLGTITVSLQHPDYHGLPTFVVLADVEHPREAARAIAEAANTCRRARSNATDSEPDAGT